MSNYQLEPKNDNHLVMVGWDDPLNTFFIHVIDESLDEDDEGRDVLWLGCTYQEIHDVNRVIALAKPYANIPQDLKANLLKDSD